MKREVLIKVNGAEYCYSWAAIAAVAVAFSLGLVLGLILSKCN